MKILVFPEDKGNPYQSLLYTPMTAKGAIIKYLEQPTGSASINVFLRIGQIVWNRARGYSVFHLHWVYAFIPRMRLWQTEPFNTVAYYYYLLFLMTVKALGYKLIWTAHNTLPHELVFRKGRELKARKWLVNLADLVIVHSESSIDEFAKLGIFPKKHITIPHGSYIGVYSNTISQMEARKVLGLSEKKFIYLFLGMIRAYKGLDRLLEAYSKIRTDNATLVIVGVCHNPELRRMLDDRNDESILWYDGMVPNQDMQIYFNAADVVVLPFKKITTSGSSLLALSFGKAVIVPAMGDLAKLPTSVAYLYNTMQTDGLEQAMLSAMSDKKETEKKGHAALEYAKSLAWPNIAAETLQAFEEMFKK